MTNQFQATPVPFESDVDVLNYALSLEHLESAFYTEGVAGFATQDFVDIGFDASVLDYLTTIRDHETAHVEALTDVISGLGGEPVEAVEYDFGYTDLTGFLAVAQELENTGVAAYTGAAQFLIDNDDLLTAALTIHGVEARHAAYLSVLNGTSPFPDAVNAPLTPDEVLEMVAPFIQS